MSDREISVNPATLVPASEWQSPTPEEVREMMRRANLSGTQLGNLLGVSRIGFSRGRKKAGTGRNVRRWTAMGQETSPIPYAAWAILVYQAGMGVIWVSSP